jgi:hypothetical protein
MTQKKRRIATMVGGVALAMCMSKGLLAMVDHNLWLGWMNYGNGDVISCQGLMDYAEDERQATAVLWGPEGQLLDVSQIGEDHYYVLAAAESPSVGPGTYHCHVDFTEINNDVEEEDSADDYLVVN